MKDKVFNIEDAEVSCFFTASDPYGSDEYEVDIKVYNRLYRIYTSVDAVEKEDAICHRVYSEWKNGLHNDIIAEII